MSHAEINARLAAKPVGIQFAISSFCATPFPWVTHPFVEGQVVTNLGPSTWNFDYCKRVARFGWLEKAAALQVGLLSKDDAKTIVTGSAQYRKSLDSLVAVAGFHDNWQPINHKQIIRNPLVNWFGGGVLAIVTHDPPFVAKFEFYCFHPRLLPKIMANDGICFVLTRDYAKTIVDNFSPALHDEWSHGVIHQYIGSGQFPST